MKMVIDAREAFRQAIVSRFGLAMYSDIMVLYEESENLLHDDVFHRKFNGFYKVRRSGMKWLPVYYQIFEDLRKKRRSLDFKGVLTELWRVDGTVDASFVSKMFHTVQPSLPIIDSHVLKATGLGEIKGAGAKKIESAVAVYEDLMRLVKDYLKTDNCKRNLRLFDGAPSEAWLNS